MTRSLINLCLVCGLLSFAGPVLSETSTAHEEVANIVPQAWGYIPMNDVKVKLDKSRTYKAVLDAVEFPDDPTKLSTAVNILGFYLNALDASETNVNNGDFVIIFHGAALDSVLKDEYYKDKHGVKNPNLQSLTIFKERGIPMFVCGHQLVMDGVDRDALAPEIEVAADALLALLSYQNLGYPMQKY